MGFLKNKFIVTLLFLFSFCLLVFISYLTLNQYKIYQQEKNRNIYTYISSISNLIQSVLNEEKKSLYYLLSRDNKDKTTLIEQQRKTDITIQSFYDLIKNDKKLSHYSKNLNMLQDKLVKIREKKLYNKKSILEILFEYDLIIQKSILNMLDSINIDFENDKVISYVYLFKSYLSMKATATLEFSYIAYFVHSHSPMLVSDKVKWQEMIEKDTLPKMRSDVDIVFENLLNSVIDNKTYRTLIKQERDMIMAECNLGKYSTSLNGWEYALDKRENYLLQIESIFNHYFKENTRENNKVFLLFFYVFLVILLLSFMYFIGKKLTKKIKNHSINKETLEDIDLVFNDSQQRELKRLLKQEKIDYIYRFLIQAIKDANQTKDLFLANMSHEIRTPLNGILGFTQLLKESKDPQEQAEFISIIEKSSDNLLTIVNDILDLSKIKAQKIELEEIDFDPIDSFEVAVESYAAKASSENIELSFFIDPELPTLVKGDPTKISQILVNLISNAIKFTSKNGEVKVYINTIRETSQSFFVYFSVEDTGIGITEAQQEKIFEAFTQADISTSRQYGGTGLGLSISGKFLEVMGSKLEIKSVKDEGSTFFFTLELSKSEKAKHRKVADMSHLTVGILNSHIDTEYYINTELETYITYTGAKIKRYTDKTLLDASKNLPDILFIDHKFRYRGGEIEKFLAFNTKIIVMSTGEQKRNLKRYAERIDRVLYKPVNLTKVISILSEKETEKKQKKQILFPEIHILVAEDNKINQKLIFSVLQKLGIKVSIVNDGQEAVDARMKNSYDMIFMDIEMPIMGGMKATGNILLYERNNQKKHIPIIALTANALSGDKEKYIGAGMDGYLSKPLQLDALKELLKSYFRYTS